MNDIKKQIIQNIENAETAYIESTQAMIDIYYNAGLPADKGIKRLIFTISTAIENYAKEGDLQ